MIDDEPEKRAVRPNKSAQKRELAELQRLAERMLELSDKELVRLGVDQALREALAQVRPMRASGARNRQLKHCLRFMDRDDLVDIERRLDNRQVARTNETRAFHALEDWRDRLVSNGDDALTALYEQFPGVDRQRVRQAVRDARRENETGKPAGAGRRLFRLLREMLPVKDD
jgi:ribosome-associated protein